MKKKTVAVFTTTRADFYILENLLLRLKKSKNVNLDLFVGGTHLKKAFGETINDITPTFKNEIKLFDYLQPGDLAEDIANSMSMALKISSQLFKKHKPDLVILLGDRYEILSIASAALISNIPIAHIHGGEVTQGAIDDAFRHSITKMSNYHFVSTSEHKKRVIQLGEKRSNVFNFGAPALENLKNTKIISKNLLSDFLNLNVNKPYFLATFHPVTYQTDGDLEGLKNMMKAMLSFNDINIICTFPNADVNGQKFIFELKKFRKEHPNRIILKKSVGSKHYFSLMSNSIAVVGNSSSGIIEAPSLDIPTVNIGERQRGRPIAKSIICCSNKKESIVKALSQTLKIKRSRISNPYYKPNTSKKIYEKIIEILPRNKSAKKFVDLK